ncbi:membrane fusion protein, macrolide-specific efflux system [Halopseudomonas xinjiangensis]|uniref:Membrane fusion protein, macrolide-specific efflux system n=1 Tax=Halopseudomonas xinjiangensis TaxID=487184 RepID=A0A1H1MXB1_9GAMM|nr:efflux RND transporter periplasmic adaptor subunit [Halopseudomonas xinjiangensis]SDR91386.1 membrane fusion protein, macrolide-specific efflux system [Halopseudomonas xinjiangensis]
MNPASSGKRRRHAWLATIVVLIIALAAWYAWSRSANRQPAFATATVERGDVEDSITALGTLEPLNYVDVGTQVSGQLSALHVQLGDEVEEGQLLAEIDPTIYLARVEATRAQLANLRAQLADREAQQTLARLQAERQQNLIKLDATSQEQVESADATLRSATAQIQAIKAQIRQTESALKGEEADLNYTRVYAPMGGTVVQQLANQGQTLNANQTAPIIVQIADLSTMTVRTQVSEADIAQLEVGMPAYFSTLGQPRRRWEGTLRQILPTPEVLNNVVLFNALFDVPNPDGDLLPQMSAQVFFVRAAAQDVLTIPVTALQPSTAGRAPGEAVKRQPSGDGRQAQVQVLGADGEPGPRDIRVGTRNRVSVEVIEGLEEGDQVVTGRISASAADTRSGPPRRFM